MPTIKLGGRLNITYSPDKGGKFDPWAFLGFGAFFKNKPIQLELLIETQENYALNPVFSYATLYKIIEFEYHLSDDRGRKTKNILKKSGFANIIKNFEYNNLKGDDLIDYIVDLRNKCDHLKKSTSGSIFGMLNSNIEDRRILSKFIPTLIQICAKVIDSHLNLEFS